MNLSAHFTLDEFVTSQTASRRGINNTPSESMIAILTETAEFMEKIRGQLNGRPILVSSAFRCRELDLAVSGRAASSPTSDHTRGKAVDFICPGFGSPIEICRGLAPLVDALGIGQLIHEFDAWVHISRRMVDRPINRMITINASGVSVGFDA